MATVRALRECYCGTPAAFRTADSEPFQYIGPKASYLELIEGDWVSSADLPQLDHDKDGRPGGAKAPPLVDPLAGADDATRDAIESRLRPVSDEHVHAEPAPKDKKPKRSVDPERAAIIATLRAATPPIKFFAGAPTEELKKLLPG